MISPPVWTPEQLEVERVRAVAAFRRERLQEPLETYLEFFDEYQGVLEDLLEQTVDLTRLRPEAIAGLSDAKFQEAVRYLTGPPISLDDWRVVADAALGGRALSANPETVDRLIQVILDGLDRRRFPWVSEGRDATPPERDAAILASAALIAMRKTETHRRNTGKSVQEALVEESLLTAGLQRVAACAVQTSSQAPKPWTFCRETKLGTDKADFLVGLGDERVMPIECKVSNSYINSIKRLNHDAAAKASNWTRDFGANNVVPTAVLSGVYKLHKLVEAQQRGLTLFWAHDLDAMIEWILSTKG